MKDKNSSIPFKKFYELTKKYMTSSYVKSDIKTDTISDNTIRTYITTYNKYNLLEKQGNGNRFREDILDKNIFKNIDYNAFVVSSIVKSKQNATNAIIKYLFKDSVTNAQNQIIYKYDKFFNEKLINIIDQKKYLKIISQVEYNNSNSTKLSIQFNINNVLLKLVILGLFTHTDTWYIVGYNLNNKRLEIYDQKDIVEFGEPNYKTNIEYINPNSIDDIIKKFIEIKCSNDTEETFYLKAPAEVINKLLQTELISDFEIYSEEKDYKDNTGYYDDYEDEPLVMSKYSPSTPTRRIVKQKTKFISKIDLSDSTNFNIDNIEYYDYESSLNKKDYVFKIKTNSLKKDFIQLNFKNQISIINNSIIKVI